MDTHDGQIDLTGSLIFYDWRYIEFSIVDSDPVVVTEAGRDFRMTKLRCDDVYTFSTAETYSEAAHKRWRDQEGYDACYRIVSVNEFQAAIERALSDCNFVLMGNACYYDETTANNEFYGTFHPALLKRKIFGEQAEMRFIWELRANAAVRREIGHGTTMDGALQATNANRMTTLSPRDIIIPGIGNYCVRHRVLPT